MHTLLQRLFAFFENVDPGAAGKSDGSDKHHGGAGLSGGLSDGASFLMGSASMYSPMVGPGGGGLCNTPYVTPL